MRQFFIGGARSGKSRLAEAEALAWPGEVIYLATAQVGDEEFAQRVAAHRARRPAQWGLIEAPASLAQALNAAAAPERLLLVDCLTLWLVGFLTADGVDEARWRQERAALLQLLPQLPGKIVLVSNEIGWGVVPMGAATRWFVDELGWLNQAVAACCERVTLAAAGLPLVLKSS
ncbi:bifunctional adenosylcobinamide kinase/adenosylcobinamide-phosphate guanylyltransferase [Rivihabitans pingtungensis]|uniref:bifunctional adenosylcobinamide kinase/adenosylcobinamide-phosphate guanylyltransferase n=3 Tax=Rivihabitans pingtungensis TaxID=1054498 RepID=UPI00289D431F|nr:bifunctional adenosylcobinamide kinase/adenosylcobinamide-phosphate guanylyltransferase [Rivihabitans pingtungensis]